MPVIVTANGSANQPVPLDNSRGASGGESHSIGSRERVAPAPIPTSLLNVPERELVGEQNLTTTSSQNPNCRPLLDYYCN